MKIISNNPRKLFLPVVCAFSILILCAQKPVTHKKYKHDNRYGKASFYANQLEGLNTSSGDVYNKNDFTCAHRTLPFNTILTVTNATNGKTAIVRVNDRGPYRKGRIIDLSRAAAQKLGMLPNGVIEIKLQKLSILNLFPFNDSLLHAGDLINAPSYEKGQSMPIIKVWQTEDLEHAVYMAASIENEYSPDSVYLRVKGEGDKRSYEVLMHNKAKKEDADKLIAGLKQDGFFFCKLEKKQN